MYRIKNNQLIISKPVKKEDMDFYIFLVFRQLLLDLPFSFSVPLQIPLADEIRVLQP